MVYKGEFFNEFVTTVNTCADKVLDILSEHGILEGIRWMENTKDASFGVLPRSITRKKLTIWCGS